MNYFLIKNLDGMNIVNELDPFLIELPLKNRE